MYTRHLPSIAAIGISAITVVGALFIMIVQGSPETGSPETGAVATGAAASTDMSTGVTVTDEPGDEVTPVERGTTVPATKATPSITGTAELPTEEEGLPGR